MDVDRPGGRGHGQGHGLRRRRVEKGIIRDKPMRHNALSRLRIFLYLTAGAVGYTLFFQFFYCWMRYGSPIPFDFAETMLSMGFNFVPIYLLVLCNYLLIFHLTHGKRPLVSALYCVILSTLLLLGISLLFTLLTGYPVEYAGTMFCNLLILAGLESIYYARYSAEILRRQALQEHETLMYKYEALKAQINPHFLFNSLNILYSFIPPDLGKAREYVLHLSRIYRYTLNHNDKPMVSVRTELDFLESYIKILQIRFHDKLQVSITGLEGHADRNIIPYSLQMLVENVTKHNVITSTSPMTIHIAFSDHDVTVSNPIRPKASDAIGTRFGLSYLRHLYDYHGREFTVYDDGKVFKASVPYI